MQPTISYNEAFPCWDEPQLTSLIVLDCHFQQLLEIRRPEASNWIPTFNCIPRRSRNNGAAIWRVIEPVKTVAPGRTSYRDIVEACAVC